jgi:hypothetical protein
MANPIKAVKAIAREAADAGRKNRIQANILNKKNKKGN